MSQDVWSTINPNTTSGTMLASLLTDFKDALMSGLAGTSRPTQLDPGGVWIDTSEQAAPNYYWAYKIWTGTEDIEIFRIKITSNYGGALTCEAIFEVEQISADTVGAIQELIKNRALDVNNGQVLSGDTVAEIQWVGRTNTSTNPTVGYIKWVSTDAETTSAFGGTLSFFSTPDASSTITEHLKLIDGLFETTAPFKLNSLRLVSQDIATTATIVQLSASKAVVEFTGSTATDVQGVNAGHDSKILTIHNRSTANITLKHENGTATAVDRLDLPGSADYLIEPESTATLYYCTNTTRWKLKETVRLGVALTSETFYGPINTWTAPSGVSQIKVTAKKYSRTMGKWGFLDPYGNMYVWGSNVAYHLGTGDNLNKSSPVVVLGGLNFIKFSENEDRYNLTSNFAIASNGALYAWGFNVNGRLGLGDTTGRSSPVAVLGGLRFHKVYKNGGHGNVFGLTTGNVLYAWGRNDHGQLGVGDVTPRSSPVAVLGGLKFHSMTTGVDIMFAVGLTTSGTLYAWGRNDTGQLGVGDLVDRSSPIAVAGVSGLTFKKVGSIDFGAGTQFATTYALTVDGDLYAWGLNDKGQIGDGTTVNKSSAVLVVGGITFKDFFPLPPKSIIAMAEDGTLYAWGDNSNGRLGVGDTTARSSPVAVLGGLVFEEVYTSSGFTIARQADGTLYGWGINDAGQLGNGSVNSRSSPDAVVGGFKFSKVGTDIQDQISRVWGALPTGQLYSWGNNFVWQLGLGDANARSSPVAVLGAHTCDVVTKSSEFFIDVTGGNTYDIILAAQSYFGNTPLGLDVEKIIIDYEERGN